MNLFACAFVDQGTSKEKRSVLIKYVIFLLAATLTSGAFSALLGLQSSVNIVDAVGVSATTATYITSAIFSITLTPVVFRFLGVKWALVASYCLYLTYIAANYYPNVYVLTVAGIGVGISEAVAWPSFMIYGVHYGRRYAKLGNKPRDHHNAKFIGCFMAFFSLSMVISYLVIYCILYVGRASEPLFGRFTNDTENDKLQRFAFCGSEDCQDPSCTSQNLAQYVPPQLTRYIAYGLLGAIAVVSIAVQVVLVKNPRQESEADVEADVADTKQNGRDNPGGVSVSKSISAITSTDDAKAPEAAKIGYQTHSEKELPFIDAHTKSESNLNEQRKEKNKDDEHEEQRCLYVAALSVKDTLQQSVKFKHLLLLPITLCQGILQAFTYLEMTRAFASCILGIDQVGLCMAVYTAVKTVSCVVVGKVSAKTGRHPTMLLATLLDIAFQLALLLWTPSESSKWLVYLLFGFVGIGDGTRMTITPDTHAAFFPENQQKALVVWSFWYLGGWAFQSGWSAAVCVKHKIYFQLALLLFGMGTYSVGELRHHKEELLKIKPKINAHEKSHPEV